MIGVLCGMASLSDIVDRTLPRPYAEKVIDCLADQLSDYLNGAF